MTVRVLAVAKSSVGAAPLTAILADERTPRRPLIHWWGGYAWETLQKEVTLDDVLKDPAFQQRDLTLPKDWEEGYLRATDDGVTFVYGKPPSQQEAANTQTG